MQVFMDAQMQIHCTPALMQAHNLPPALFGRMAGVFYMLLQKHRVEQTLNKSQPRKMEWTLNKSQHRKLTVEKKILLLLLPGFELTLNTLQTSYSKVT